MSVSEVIIPLPMIVIQVGGEGHICELVNREGIKGTKCELFEDNTGEQISIDMGSRVAKTRELTDLCGSY